MASIKISGLPGQTTAAEDDYLVFGKDEAMKIPLSALRAALGVPEFEFQRPSTWHLDKYVQFPSTDLPLIAWKVGKMAHVYGYIQAKVEIPPMTGFIFFPDGWKPLAPINKVLDGYTFSINQGQIYSDSGVPAGGVFRIDFSYPTA